MQDPEPPEAKFYNVIQIGENYGTIKCPKCKHEFSYDALWIKAATIIGCVNCTAMIQIRKPELYVPKLKDEGAH